MVTIRKATREDLITIQDLNNKLCAKEHSEFDSTVNPEFATSDGGKKYFQHSLESNDSLVLIAEDDAKPAGYIVGSIAPVGDFRVISNLCEIDNMWVGEEYRGQGIGKQLINRVEMWAKEKGVIRMRVVASYQNERAIRFYKREGFGAYDLILEKDL